VAALAVRFLTRFLISARGRVADIAYGMRWDSQERRFRVFLVAVSAVRLRVCIGKIVGDVQFVLLRIEESVEIISLREIALRRTSRQAIGNRSLRLVADRARLLRRRRELRDVAFEASLMTGEFQGEFLITLGGSDDYLIQLRAARTLVTRIAFQHARIVRSRNVDRAKMVFVLEAFVVYRFFSRLLRGRLLLALHRKSAEDKSG
jgi:hypothetical protein